MAHSSDGTTMIGSMPTGGLELNFTLNTNKANKINEREVPDQGLNQPECVNAETAPTGGTKRLFEDDFPLKYSLLNAFSESVSAHCSSRLFTIDDLKQSKCSMYFGKNVDSVCSSNYDTLR
jgi:hypothetical protein